MPNALLYGGISLVGAGAVLLVLAWMIGVLGHVKLINNYRAHPERYPDAEGLGRWMAWTLAVGGFSLAILGLAVITNAIEERIVGVWAGVTGAVVLAGACSGLARHRKP